MVDPSITISRVQQLASTVSGLGQQLSAAASTGQFDSILSGVNADLAAISDPEASTGSYSSSGSVESTAGGEGGASLAEVSAQADPLAGGMGSLGLSAASGSTAGQQVVADAEQYLGVPYQWGGTSPSGFDCSGLVQYVYSGLGVSLPRTSEEQATVGTPVDSVADAQPGDLVFFAGSDGTATSPGHVGIYIGNGMMIDAPHTGADVRIEPVGQPVAIRRVLPDSSSVSGVGDQTLSSALLTAGIGSGSTGAGVTGLGTTSAATTDAQLATLGVPTDLQDLFTQAGQRYGISPALLGAVAKQESGFQTSAVSSAGAEGIMQLMPATAAGLGVDPSQAIDGAAQLLSSYMSKFGGSVPLTLAAYNAGPAAVTQYGGVPPYSQTQSYVADITSMLQGAQ